MSDQEFGNTPPGPESSQGPTSTGESWGTPQATYAEIPYTPPPAPGYTPPAATTQGLSESTACALAYITFVPALIFLLVPPYNQSAKIKFHAFQELGLSVIWICLSIVWVIPILGWLIGMLGFLCLLAVWIMCIYKASQGGAFKLPFIGKFAAEQSGYTI